MTMNNKRLSPLPWCQLAIGLIVTSQVSLGMATIGLAASWSRPMHYANNDIPALADRLLGEGLALYKSREYSEAISVWQSALVSYQAMDDRLGEGRASEALGLAHRALGNYGDAISFYERARELYEKLGNQAQLQGLLGNLGNAYAIIGRYELALELQYKRLQIVRELQDKEAEQNVLANLGATYADQGDDYDQVVYYYNQSLDLAQALNNKEAEASVLLNMGIAYNVQVRDYDQAISTLQQAQTIAQAIGDQGLIAEVVASQGFAYERLGQFERSLEFYDQSITLFNEVGALASAAMSLNNRAHAQLVWSDASQIEPQVREELLQSATNDLDGAITILESLQENLTLDINRVSLFDTQVMTYNLLQQVLVARKQYEKALEVTEQGRSRPFARLLEERQRVIQSDVSLTQLKAIANEQNATIVEFALIPEDSVIHQGKSGGPYGKLYVWIVSPEGKVDFEEQDLDDNLELDKLIEVTRNALDRSRAGSLLPVDTVEDTSQIFNAKLTELYDILIDPISKYLPPPSSKDDQTAEKVIFIPQGELFLVPFPALINQKGEFLVEHYTVQTAPSIQSLNLTRQILASRSRSGGQTLQAEDFLIVGDPDMPEVFELSSGSQTPVKKKALPLCQVPQLKPSQLPMNLAFPPMVMVVSSSVQWRQKVGSGKACLRLASFI
ncbi:MAG: tetratricopeptide repeat protein [Leptolyngbya sp. SIOISBB]|nr:tetratricopeptide repeat protein [Leptolyngbya sp. SIOISBB]